MLCRITASAAYLAATALCFGQTTTVKLDAISKGKPVGTGTMTRTMLPGGAQRLRTHLKLKQGAKDVVLEMTSVSDSTGASTDKTAVITADGRTVTMTCKLSSQGAKVTTAGGRTQTIPLKSKTSRSDPSELWFLKVRPKAGQSAVFQSFEPFEMGWSDATVTYVGDKPLLVAGKKVLAHYLKQVANGSVTHIYLDDHAMPLRIDEPSLTLVRAK